LRLEVSTRDLKGQCSCFANSCNRFASTLTSIEPKKRIIRLPLAIHLVHACGKDNVDTNAQKTKQIFELHTIAIRCCDMLLDTKLMKRLK